MTTDNFVMKQDPSERSIWLAMASGRALVLALLLAFCAVTVLGRTPSWDGKIAMPTEEKEKDEEGTRWAILIAGSAGYWNYRHQVCMYSIFLFEF